MSSYNNTYHTLIFISKKLKDSSIKEFKEYVNYIDLNYRSMNPKSKLDFVESYFESANCEVNSSIFILDYRYMLYFTDNVDVVKYLFENDYPIHSDLLEYYDKINSLELYTFIKEKRDFPKVTLTSFDIIKHYGIKDTINSTFINECVKNTDLDTLTEICKEVNINDYYVTSIGHNLVVMKHLKNLGVDVSFYLNESNEECIKYLIIDCGFEVSYELCMHIIQKNMLNSFYAIKMLEYVQASLIYQVNSLDMFLLFKDLIDFDDDQYNYMFRLSIEKNDYKLVKYLYRKINTLEYTSGTYTICNLNILKFVLKIQLISNEDIIVTDEECFYYLFKKSSNKDLLFKQYIKNHEVDFERISIEELNKETILNNIDFVYSDENFKYLLIKLNDLLTKDIINDLFNNSSLERIIILKMCGHTYDIERNNLDDIDIDIYCELMST